MKGEIMYKILNALGNVAIDQVDFMRAVINAGYGASMGRIDNEFDKIQNKRTLQQIQKDNHTKFIKYLSKLKKDGLIQKNNNGKIYLSDKGKKKLVGFNSIVSASRYEKKVGDKVIVISYDIPVAFNRQRNVLRDILNMLGFNLVHKSVWVGKVELPQRFVTDLNKMKILDYVEILEVAKNGTLKSKN